MNLAMHLGEIMLDRAFSSCLLCGLQVEVLLGQVRQSTQLLEAQRAAMEAETQTAPAP